MLLARCGQIVGTGGRVIVEVDPAPERDRGYQATVVDVDGRSSSPFPWYEIGVDALRERVRGTGLEIVETWTLSGRAFVRLSRLSDPFRD